MINLGLVIKVETESEDIISEETYAEMEIGFAEVAPFDDMWVATVYEGGEVVGGGWDAYKATAIKIAKMDNPNGFPIRVISRTGKETII